MSTERIVADLVRRMENRFYGKYRGFVVDNADPEHLGRLKLQVPSVLGRDVVTGWATPCVPFGGDANQGFLFIPEVSSGVWVEFEEGDLEFPIWVGAFWSKPGGKSELPKPNDPDGTEQGAVQDTPTRKIIKTLKGHTLQFEDADGDEMITLLEGINGHVVTLDVNGIQITDGKNGHRITLDASGVIVSDGVNVDNQIAMGAAGLTVQDKNGNKIILGPSGIQVGGGAVESMVLGTSLAANIASFLIALNTHTHTGNLGAPTSPPIVPMQLQVPLSAKQKVE